MMISKIKGKLLIIGAFVVLTGCAISPFSELNSGGVRTPLEELSEANQAHYRLSLEYIESANFEVAQTKLTSILMDSPNFADGYNALGVLYERRGQVTNAKRSFLRAMELDPNYTTAVNNYVTLRCYLEGMDSLEEEAAARRENALKSRLFAGAAACALQNKEWPRAEQLAYLAIDADERYANSYYALAVAKKQQNALRGAMEALDQYNDLSGYSRASAELGLSLSRALDRSSDIARYKQVLTTQFKVDEH